MKTKEKNKIKVNVCTKCYDPIYLKFNFSYIVYDEGVNKNHIYKLWERMRELSREKYTVILNRPKEVGFEYESIEISKDIPCGFSERFPSDSAIKKFHIMRLYTNNNPLPSRIIGKIIRNVFYIFYIDINGDLYKH